MNASLSGFNENVFLNMQAENTYVSAYPPTYNTGYGSLVYPYEIHLDDPSSGSVQALEVRSGASSKIQLKANFTKKGTFYINGWFDLKEGFTDDIRRIPFKTLQVIVN